MGSNAATPPDSKPSFWGRAHGFHRKLEHWTRLQLFMHDLPNEYSYAAHVKDKRKKSVSQVLVKVGDKAWFGVGTGNDAEQALTCSLLNAGHVLTQNRGMALLAKWKIWFLRKIRRFRT